MSCHQSIEQENRNGQRIAAGVMLVELVKKVNAIQLSPESLLCQSYQPTHCLFLLRLVHADSLIPFHSPSSENLFSPYLSIILLPLHVLLLSLETVQTILTTQQIHLGYLFDAARLGFLSGERAVRRCRLTLLL